MLFSDFPKFTKYSLNESAMATLSDVKLFHQIYFSCKNTRAYLRCGVQGVQTPPPPEIFRFFFEKGKKRGRKKRGKKGWEGGGYLLTIYF